MLKHKKVGAPTFAETGAMAADEKLALRVACIIPTYNGVKDLERLLGSLERQEGVFDVIVVDSSSVDGSYELACERVSTVVRIPSSEFNHGGTRQLMVDSYPGYDVYVFITQDAYLEDSWALNKLVEPFANQSVGAVCGRQLPHLDANVLAQHARSFNYPSVSIVKTKADAAELGIKTPFMSNSFSAYRGIALRAVGGFPGHVILSEDMYVAAKMLIAGWAVAYSGESSCRHSHNYTLLEEFRRYFDQGVFHAREEWIRRNFGGAGGEGLRYVVSELKFLGFSRLYLWPGALLRNGFKLIAYKLGQKEVKISYNLKRRLSMHRRFWDGPYA